MSEEFEVKKLHKWADNIESILSDWASEEIEVFYGVDDILELTGEQIQEVENWVDLETGTGYDYVLIGFRNLISFWEGENQE
jgi:hypothetical protein